MKPLCLGYMIATYRVFCKRISLRRSCKLKRNVTKIFLECNIVLMLIVTEMKYYNSLEKVSSTATNLHFVSFVPSCWRLEMFTYLLLLNGGRSSHDNSVQRESKTSATAVIVSVLTLACLLEPTTLPTFPLAMLIDVLFSPPDSLTYATSGWQIRISLHKDLALQESLRHIYWKFSVSRLWWRFRKFSNASNISS